MSSGAAGHSASSNTTRTGAAKSVTTSLNVEPSPLLSSATTRPATEIVR
ncbi:MAG TPA: hypothetical protein VLX56_02715 [Nitrososphaerales archaeon]|nr:hypothetical protein [Nitrososphaerales archaeon]